MNSLLNILNTATAGLKIKYINKIIQNNYNELLPISIKLKQNYPQYEMFTYVLHNDKLGFKNICLSSILSTELLLFFIQKDFCVDKLIDHVNSIKVHDYLYFLCIKELLCKDFIEYDINKLLDNLDDFDIYKYCLKNNIEVKPRETINYKYFLAHKGQIDTNFIKSIKNYKDLEYLIKTTKMQNDDNNLIKFLKYGYDKQICKFLFVNFNKKNDENDEDFDNLKLILSHLIASKKINNLVMALYLAKKYDFNENYEIKLIHIFLLKYFMFYDDLLLIRKSLDIKNNQEFSLAYLWSDVYINLINRNYLVDDTRKYSYFGYITKTNNVIQNSLSIFIDSNKLQHAYSLIEMYKKIKNDIVEQELKCNKFLGLKTQTTFSYLLGEKCKYLFDKQVIEYSISCTGDVFINDLVEIKDESFKEWFSERIWKYQKIRILKD